MSDSSDSGGGSSWGEAAMHGLDGALEAAGDFVKETGEEAANAFEAAGATAEDAANLVSSDADAIPVIGEVVSGAQMAYHAGAAIYDAATGDMDGAKDHAISGAEAAGNVLTGGLLGLGEGAWDLGNAIAGGDESTDAHHMISSGVNALGDMLSSSDTGDSGSSGDDADSAGSSDDDSGSSGDDSDAYQDDPSVYMQ